MLIRQSRLGERQRGGEKKENASHSSDFIIKISNCWSITFVKLKYYGLSGAWVREWASEWAGKVAAQATSAKKQVSPTGFFNRTSEGRWCWVTAWWLTLHTVVGWFGVTIYNHIPSKGRASIAAWMYCSIRFLNLNMGLFICDVFPLADY